MAAILCCVTYLVRISTVTILLEEGWESARNASHTVRHENFDKSVLPRVQAFVIGGSSSTSSGGGCVRVGGTIQKCAHAHVNNTHIHAHGTRTHSRACEGIHTDTASEKDQKPNRYNM